MRRSSRLDRIPPYMLAELESKVRLKSAAGVDVISLGIGDPDTPTYPPIVAAAQRAVADPSTHQYPSNQGRWNRCMLHRSRSQLATWTSR